MQINVKPDKVGSYLEGFFKFSVVIMALALVAGQLLRAWTGAPLNYVPKLDWLQTVYVAGLIWLLR